MLDTLHAFHTSAACVCQGLDKFYTVNSRYSGHPGDGHLVSVIARVRSNGARTKFPNFSVYRMSVVNNSVFGLKCLVYSNI